MAEEETCGFSINKEYAERYNTWRQKEELQRLKTKYGDVGLGEDSEDSSSSESEDDDATALTPQVEKDWLKTLAALKAKDPKIYDKNVTFFHSEESNSDSDSDESEKKKTRKKEKPMYLRDYERKVILEKGGVVSESEEDEEKEAETYKPGYYEEQEEIKKSITSAAAEIESESDEDLLVRRRKTKDEEEKEESEYREWLKGRKDIIEHDTKVEQDLAPLKKLWNDPDLNEGEKFLRDYILNKRYKEEDDDDRIPTYEEIVDGEDLSEDEKMVEKQEIFERKYNFRYEEPDQDFIKSYPRTVGDSLRRKDNKRSKKRLEVKDRKEKEKAKKREELKQLKNMKRREIMSKIDQLREITGNREIGITEGDIEDDFDPKKYDEMMKKAFDNDFYDDDEEMKPVFPQDEEIEDENWDEWAGEEEGTQYDQEGNPVAGPSGSQDYYEPSCEDPDFNMDADYDPSQERPDHAMIALSKKKKKKSKFRQAVEKKKPVFDPREKSFEEYFDEYYKLDYEDMIGDLPCRFRYRQVPANDYGLSMEEILKCNDKELNAWVSLKKVSQHKTLEEEHYEKRLFTKKARNKQKKLNVLTSLKEKDEEEEEEIGPDANPDNQRIQNQDGELSGQSKNKGKGRKNKAAQNSDIDSQEMAAQRSDSNNQDQELQDKNRKTGEPKKKKRKVEEQEEGEEGAEKEEERGSADTNEVKEGRRKKKKERADVESGNGEVAEVDSSSDLKEVRLMASKSETKKSVKEKKKKKKQKAGTMSDERLKAFGINPKKFKYTHLPRLKEQRKAKKASQSKS